jgi:lipopolysaccharide transport system permease protein
MVAIEPGSLVRGISRREVGELTETTLRLNGAANTSRIARAGSWMLAAGEGLRFLWRYRALCREMVRRDLTGQFANQLLGSFWAVGHPLALLAVYVFVFALVLKVKIIVEVAMPRDYTTYILSGLVPWLAISQAIGRSPTTLISQSNLVKQVVFPIEILPMVAVIVSLVPLFVGAAVLVGYQLLTGQGLPLTIALAPVYLIQLFLFLAGIAFLLAVVTPFFRDLKDAVTVFLTVGVFLIPAFWLPAWVPPAFAPLINFNPFSYPIWVGQDIFYFGRFDHPVSWLVFTAMSLLSFVLGYRMFRYAKPYVGNVL